MNVRRLPGFLYNYKLAAIILTFGPCLIIYLLLHWGVMCTNLEAWHHVSTVVSYTAANCSGRDDDRRYDVRDRVWRKRDIL